MISINFFLFSYFVKQYTDLSIGVFPVSWRPANFWYHFSILQGGPLSIRLSKIASTAVPVCGGDSWSSSFLLSFFLHLGCCAWGQKLKGAKVQQASCVCFFYRFIA